ncbi:hypothetical protein NQ176_g10997 [Zarea fungicola]|uniref:Uncharacterized protein n=1 Tax=Zarea fungicola TaxID=93591 RepID=A0ACC1MES0_9HYPO|nr:hypothetical protein NQ176_g10997 [Lecanicillium fungicola]
MGFFDGHEDSYNEYNNAPAHEASISHELLSGAAAFAAARAYENHVAQNGPPPTHALAKELFAGFAGAFIDREVETKGLDFIDREKAKRQAEQHVENGFQEQHYNNWGN